jgi:hypothetical protein
VCLRLRTRRESMLRPFSWRSGSSEKASSHRIHETAAFPIVAVQIDFAPFSRHKILDAVTVLCFQDLSNFFKPPVLFIPSRLVWRSYAPLSQPPATSNACFQSAALEKWSPLPT